MFKIQDTTCYNIVVTLKSCPKDGLLKFVKSEFQQVSSFSCIWNKDWRFDIILLLRSITLLFITHNNWLIACKNYSKFCTRRCKKQRYVYCDYNGVLMTCISSNMALLKKPLNDNLQQGFAQ